MNMFLEQKRKRKIVEKAIKNFDLRLDDLTIFTEGATGNYLYTPIASALAGAKHVYAITHDSIYGSAKSVKSLIMDEAKKLGVDDKISVIFEKDTVALSKSDIVTNTGFVRPIDKEMISNLKTTAVVPLMYESWEIRKDDIDIDECRRKGIMVFGTNEESPPLDMMRYSGFLVSKLLFESGLGVHMDKILILGSGRIGRNIANFMHNNEIDHTWGDIKSLQDIDLSNYDAIIIAEHYYDSEIIGENGVLKSEDIARINPLIQIIHICGNVDIQDIRKHCLSIHPSSVKPFGYMSVTADYIGPKATIELNVAGLKVGEIMARNRLAYDFLTAYKKSLEHNLVMKL